MFVLFCGEECSGYMVPVTSRRAIALARRCVHLWPQQFTVKRPVSPITSRKSTLEEIFPLISKGITKKISMYAIGDLIETSLKVPSFECRRLFLT